MPRNLPKLNITKSSYTVIDSNSNKASFKSYIPNLIFTNEKGHSLFIGDKKDAENLKILNNFKISHVYNVAGCEVNPLWKDDLDISIGYTHMPMRDISGQQLNPLFIMFIILLIHDSLEAGNVLVNCYMGQSRSVTIVAAYLMWRCDIKFDIAMRWISSQRRCASPNYGFCNFLLSWVPPNDFHGVKPPPKIPWYTPLPNDSENEDKIHDLFW